MNELLQHRVGHLWASRARFEHEAAARFDQLAEGLTEIGAPRPLRELARRAAGDERRHARLADDLAQRFGVRAMPAAGPPARIAPLGLPFRRRVLYESVALCAVMESVSVAMLREMRRRSQDAQVRATLHAILVDEVDHSRIGWGHLAFERERGDVRWLGAFVVPMLQGTVTDEIFGAPEGERGAVLEPWGGLRRELRQQAFFDTAEGVVLAGLAHFGVPVDAGREWLHAAAR
ncbi:MAG: ferritin-like domain-containing protein [Deltaproteobacteria bacterium]|nr:MAG: ferritin-like domain-containing protein [Deltaproteobacteria bacterium]